MARRRVREPPRSRVDRDEEEGSWAYLEPKEGQYDWAIIDRMIEKWTAHGLGIAFRISCKETSTDRIEQQFATPRWVMEAGAKGGYYRMGKAPGSDAPWEVHYGDPIFLAKLDKFLATFAARYDGKPWLRYVDIGSIGDWGEGHTHSGSRKDYSLAARKQHVDLHLKHFKRAPLVISDDFVYALKDPAERQALHQHILTSGISESSFIDQRRKCSIVYIPALMGIHHLPKVSGSADPEYPE